VSPAPFPDVRLPLSHPSNPVWHPYAPDPFPGPRAFFTRAEGAYVFDAEGKRYLDATSSWWCITHGHCHPRLVEALSRQAAVLDHVMLSPHLHGPAAELASELVALLGAPFSRVFFSDDGSTAVEAALKMALQHFLNRGETGRNRVVALSGAYHGDTLGAVSVGDVGIYHDAFSAWRFPADRVPAPYCYRCPVGREYPGCGIACLAPAREIFREHGGRVAAVIVEPLVMGAGGMIVYPPEYLQGLVELAREAGALVIFDEVFTGFGRTGSMFALEAIVARPDIVCLSKGLTAGMLPLAATVVTEAVFRPFVGGADRAFQHGHTFTGNPLGCAVALESLRLFREEGTLARNRELEAVLAERREAFAALPVVGDVRQRGLVWALELVQDKAKKTPPSPLNGPGWKAAWAMWERGYWLRPLHNTLYVIPPYCTRPEELRDLLDVLYGVLGGDA